MENGQMALCRLRTLNLETTEEAAEQLNATLASKQNTQVMIFLFILSI